MYTAFAAVYDPLMQDVDYQGWAAYYAALLRHAGINEGRVCECACGTGSLTLPLSRLGYRMTGVDISDDMLRIALDKARSQGLSIPFVRQDMCALTLHRRQDAVLCTCDGINYLLSPAHLRRFFRAAYRALRPGGVLIFDMSSPYKLQNTLGNHTLGCQEEAVSYIWQNSFHPRTCTVDMHLTFFVRDDTGSYRRLEEHQTQRAYAQDVLVQALSDTGFTAISVYGDRTRRAPRPTEARWHVQASRPKE